MANQGDNKFTWTWVMKNLSPLLSEMHLCNPFGTGDCEWCFGSTAKGNSDDDDDSEYSDFHEEASSLKESIDVNGFQVLPSQEESVRQIFERHPDIAVEFRAKNQYLRKACMSFLLSLIETLCQSLKELSNEDLVEADVALTYLKDAGFKVDWLEKKLDQVKVRKEKEQFCLARLQKMEDGLLKLKEIWSDLDALVEKEEAELSDTRTPLSFDDVV